MTVDPLHVVAAAIGFGSAAFLWLSLLAGLALARGWMMTKVKHSTMLTTHGILALMGLTLGIVHGFAQLAPPATTVTLVDVVLPFTNETDPWGIGAGVIALELMIAVALSITIQKWMGFHRWRALHAMVYAAYTLMTGHMMISGAETGGLLATVGILVPWLIVVGLWVTGSAGGARRFADRFSNRGRAAQTTIQVNPVHCARFGFCEQEAPELFSLRGDGQLAYHAVVSDEKLDAAIRAARACPARAIALAQGKGAGDQRVIPLSMVAPSEPPISPAPHSWPPNDHSYPRNGRR